MLRTIASSLHINQSLFFYEEEKEMADTQYLSKITLPSGTTYELKDAGARELISELQAYTEYLGVTTTEISDGSTTNPVSIDGKDVTAKKGNIVNYGKKEFIFNGSVWQEFGDLSALGSLAYVNSAEGSFTPQGTIDKPDITVTPTTANISGISSVGALPTATMPQFNVTDEVLTITAGSFDQGSLPVAAEPVAVLTGATAALDAAPVFTGTAGTVTVAPASGS